MWTGAVPSVSWRLEPAGLRAAAKRRAFPSPEPPPSGPAAHPRQRHTRLGADPNPGRRHPSPWRLVRDGPGERLSIVGSGGRPTHQAPPRGPDVTSGASPGARASRARSHSSPAPDRDTSTLVCDPHAQATPQQLPAGRQRGTFFSSVGFAGSGRGTCDRPRRGGRRIPRPRRPAQLGSRRPSPRRGW